MEIDEFHNKVNDPQVTQLLDKILDAVLALKAHLADSNMDSNSIGGIPIYRGIYRAQPDNRQYAAKHTRWHGAGHYSRS
jgi:hypothetical protein